MEERGYTVIRCLGQGGQSRVYEVLDSSGKPRVLKQLSWVGEGHREKALHEVRLLSSLRHPCIVPYLESFPARSTPSVPVEDLLCLVMSRCERDLREECCERRRGGQPFEEPRVRSWLSQLAWGLHHLHSRRVLHRDLKSQNVLITRGGRVLLADFGVAGRLEHTEDLRHSIVGTPAFMSPEMLEGRPYGLRTDQWALGCVLFEIMALSPPFAGCECYAAVVAAVLHSPPLRAPAGYSQDLTGAVEALLSRRPQDRPTNLELLRAPWLKPTFHAFVQSVEAATGAFSRPGTAPASARAYPAPGWRPGGVSDRKPNACAGAAGRPPNLSPSPDGSDCSGTLRSFGEAAAFSSPELTFPHVGWGEDVADDDLEVLAEGAAGSPLALLSVHSDPSDSGSSTGGVGAFCGADPTSQGLGAGSWRQLLDEAEALLEVPLWESDAKEEAERLRGALSELLGIEALDRALGFLRERRPLGDTLEADELLLQVEVLDLLGEEGQRALPLLERYLALEGAGPATSWST